MENAFLTFTADPVVLCSLTAGREQVRWLRSAVASTVPARSALPSGEFIRCEVFGTVCFSPIHVDELVRSGDSGISFDMIPPAPSIPVLSTSDDPSMFARSSVEYLRDALAAVPPKQRLGAADEGIDIYPTQIYVIPRPAVLTQLTRLRRYRR